MDLPDQFREQVREICRLYNTAESDLKNIGRVEQELLITAVNQLRYAGQHLLRALDSDDVDRIRSELDAAKRHCQRAIYDVNDSGAQFYLEMIDRFSVEGLRTRRLV